MNGCIKNRKWLCILTGTGILLATYFLYYHRPTQTAVSTPFTPVTETYLRKANITCIDSALEQLRAYQDDPLAGTTFNSYTVPVYTGPLAMLNLKTSSKQVTNFKTAINNQLSSTGINFAGKYTLLSIGMTGWGLNYFLINRSTGKGIVVPYLIETVDTQKDSTLLKINPKSKEMEQTNDPENQFCGPTASNAQSADEYSFQARPFYYIWDGTEFKSLGNSAPVNTFW